MNERGEAQKQNGEGQQRWDWGLGLGKVAAQVFFSPPKQFLCCHESVVRRYEDMDPPAALDDPDDDAPNFHRPLFGSMFVLSFLVACTRSLV